jgi:hypothetical protein
MEVLTVSVLGADISAAGGDQQIQLNANGLLNGSPDLTWDSASKTFRVNGVADISDGLY